MNLLLTIGVVILLVLFSAICSGLNIALLALEKGELRRKVKLNDHAAKKVLPLREKTHLTLASLLLVNVAAISSTSLVLEPHFDGLLAGIISTLLIVIFGEVLPQAVFAKNTLTWVARFSLLLRAMNVIAYPISKPLQLLLDRLVGFTPKHLPSRHELGLIVSEHEAEPSNELDDDEIEIIRGALELSETRLQTVLTPMKKVYWLTPDTELTPDVVATIEQKLYSRIPVFNRSLSRCFGVILVKELITIDLTQPKLRVSDLPLRAVAPIGDRTALDTALRQFIEDHNHLIPVTRAKKIVGIVTIEDIIEVIVGKEIVDETDERKNRS